MNLKFWQKKPVAVVAPVMTPLEADIIADLESGPEKWTIREWKDGSIRADRREGVTILSGRGCVGEAMLIAKIEAHLPPVTATCGGRPFSKRFAEEWHKIVMARLNFHAGAALRIEQDRVLKTLTEVFGT